MRVNLHTRTTRPLPLYLIASVWALAVPASATGAVEAPSADRYSLQVFNPNASDDERLPEELRRAAGSASGQAALAEPYGLRIEWSSRERPGLVAYRVTARVDGGPLSGVAAQWYVEAGSGDVVDSSGSRHYQLRLPLSIDTQVRVRAAIEAVVADGSKVVLAVGQAHPWAKLGHSPWDGERRFAGGSRFQPVQARDALAAPVLLAPSGSIAGRLLAVGRVESSGQAPAARVTGAPDARGPPAFS